MYKGDGAMSDGTEHLLEETSDEAECPLTTPPGASSVTQESQNWSCDNSDVDEE